jgi:hypothetical protein
MGRRLRILRKIVLALLGALAIAVVLIWQFKLRHSGDLDAYASVVLFRH